MLANLLVPLRIQPPVLVRRQLVARWAKNTKKTLSQQSLKLVEIVRAVRAVGAVPEVIEGRLVGFTIDSRDQGQVV
jgi:hypothetical protein